ncbi:YceI family protein [Corynebacterium sanguinis]|uniref:Polyisoprenoid-binding protein n=1 Tax=Corynebacterium sanguinis TaxID=2594913 RepID=A0A6C1TYQ5_9CORY|nr:MULTISPECIES: YceI family protein [Corynebacterium]MBA4506214.1 polyisoprenoid-binding protein [Corynebacterium sanguinis]MCT1412769.1 YceI family protein [Corynebacterium sanguinis]MCT1425654.1 YceI family protein [Corynebacterium sanguinis]MCT1444560.1 YceI family protein [Corynebacterium sanguinis]MCT1464311.1 YceI family protein [Corynebacterium sanguinis]
MSHLTGTWNLDPDHTEIGFVARHAMVTKVRGNFPEFTAQLTVDGENPKATATIKTASIDTGNSDRDAHVHGEDFFDVEKYPEMTFESTAFNVDENGNGTVEGNLTIKSTTKPVTLTVETFGVETDPFGNERLGFEASTTIDRTDFGVDFQAPLKSGGVLVSNKITIVIEGSGIKA